MTIQTCSQCGANNRVNPQAAAVQQPVCGKCGAPLPAVAAAPSSAASKKPQVVTDSTFDSEVVKASAALPVLVDCWAAWCGPCRMIAPTLDELAAESQGRYKIAKLNVDENPRISSQFNIRSIPTMLIFKDEQIVDTIVGVVPKQSIAARLAAQVLSNT